MRLVQTCGACPEQYDVIDDAEVVVGYLRLRHGHFRAHLGGPEGPVVYESPTLGDGVFEGYERDLHLNKAQEAIEKAISDHL